MRFVSRIDLYLPADILARSPTAWDKLQSLWTTVDLATDRERNKVEAVTIVYDFRDEHNRYYPMERNLPIDVHSGQLIDRGEPWQPKAAVTIDALRDKARADNR